MLEAIDFDLHMTDEFVRPATTGKSKATNRCYCQVGFDEQGRQILQEGGSPLIWDYRDTEILEYNLSGAVSRIRLRKRPLSNGGPAQLHIDANAVLARFVQQPSKNGLHITSERWAKSDDGFRLDVSCTFEHFITFDPSGIVRIETDTLPDGVKANREVSWQRRGLLNRLIAFVTQTKHTSDHRGLEQLMSAAPLCHAPRGEAAGWHKRRRPPVQPPKLRTELITRVTILPTTVVRQLTK
ncbi:MAG: hypothetical protein NXI04_06330 [Planctomycetaceae bacterium]|nr:hypothetical protein [Planctomycetaceae bacterium]